MNSLDVLGSRNELTCCVCNRSYASKDSIKKHFLKTQHFYRSSKANSDAIKSVLPTDLNYSVCKFVSHEDTFTAEIYVFDIFTGEDLKHWVQKFMKKNLCTYVLKATKKNSTELYYAKYCCQHYRPPQSNLKRKTKGTGCPSTIIGKINKSRAVITVNFHHNHSLKSEEALRFQRLSPEVKKIFIGFFENGLTPAEALRTYITQLKQEFGDEEYNLMAANRSQVPDYDCVKHLYYKVFDVKCEPKIEEASIKDHRTIADTEIKRFEKNMNQFISLIQHDPIYYLQGLSAFNKELMKVINDTPESRMRALYSFNKNGVCA